VLDDYLPSAVNSGPWITAYTLNRLRELPDHTQFVLPICSLATPFSECLQPGSYVLPPLYHDHNYNNLNPSLMFGRMLEIATNDVDRLVSGKSPCSQAPGEQLW
jgi:hypothetical protein